MSIATPADRKIGTIINPNIIAKLPSVRRPKSASKRSADLSICVFPFEPVCRLSRVCTQKVHQVAVFRRGSLLSCWPTASRGVPLQVLVEQLRQFIDHGAAKLFDVENG